MRAALLSLLLSLFRRLLLRSDRQDGRMAQMLSGFSFDQERLVILSGDRRLSAVYVSVGEDAPVVLICHGIGEIVEYWGPVQSLLRELGVSSLVFNYSGYGTSSGTVSAAHCEEDALAAYEELVDRGHRSIVLLGFSLGSAVSSAVASRTEADGLILCEGFSTLREAGVAIGFPHWMTYLAPDVWNTVAAVSDLKMPVLVVHSDKDDLFPLSMARRVAQACGVRGGLIAVTGLSHSAPIFSPTAAYWQPIAEWIKERAPADRDAERLPVVSG